MPTFPGRDSRGRFLKPSSVSSLPKSDPPLVKFQITNPVTYLKRWWARIMKDEGVDFRFRIHPVTAVAVATVIAGAGFGLGRWVLPVPIVQYATYLGIPTPTPTPDPWKETAYTGKLQYSANRYFLVTTATEAITLEVPTSINLFPLIGKRILAVGSYNKQTRVLVVKDTTDLEILPSSPVPLPTNTASPTPTATPTPEPPSPTPTPTPVE